MKFTLSSLTVPPTPALHTSFITNGEHVALWSNSNLPTLQCPSREDAETLQCDVHTTCKCNPAEISINCVCTDFDLTNDFYGGLRNRLPIRRPWITFEESQQGSDNVSVIAQIPSLSTAEVLVTINEEFDTSAKEVTDSICKVENADIAGCYSCPQGAVAEVTCVSQVEETMAAITCEEHAFSIPCRSEGAVSSLRFNFRQAQVHLTCSSSCGATKTHFELAGVLHWTRTFFGTAEKLLAGESIIYNEVVLPDFSHIANVFMTWYKFALLLVVIVVTAIAVGYLFLWSCGLRGFTLIVRIIWVLFRNTLKHCIGIVVNVARRLCTRPQRHYAYKDL
ncbi:unnamed protein product [Nippostrongylus brasiliensis]|uniref:Phlebovirus_G2 domain-containing protein n=1 Tax=Nippostrongylus brasiliensis TaxID=27835 RepID=A0A0N4Y7J9_NIPBR|nr:unnamed protein product [Nippostrongylus brasiliensis]